MPILVLQHTPTEHPGRLTPILRDLGVRLDVRRMDLPTSQQNPRLNPIPDFDNVDGLIVLGGPMMVADTAAHPWLETELAYIKAAHDRRMPVLGICLGAQLIAKALGGEVKPMSATPAEWGMMQVQQYPIANTETILAGVPWTAWQFHAHGQEVATLPPTATPLQFTPACKNQSFKVGLRTYAFQYHFECDLAMIRAMLLSGDPQIAQAGITDPRAALAKAEEHYDQYARVSDRLCGNIATYLLSVSRRIVA